MRYVLGLDIGTNSIGWVLFKDMVVLNKGVIIFPIGTNVDKNGIESTKNMERRGYRGASRNLFRFKLRRKDLKIILRDLKMLPDFSKLQNVTGEYQASDLYALRASALDTQIPLDEIGRIFLLINKYRGFKSNSKTLIETDKDEEGKVKDGINQLQLFMTDSNARTIGEYFYKMYQKSAGLSKQGKWHNVDEPYDERALDNEGNFLLYKNRGIRRENGRYVSRSMYENEFDLIWAKQKEYYPELTGSRKEYDEICAQSIPEKREKLKTFKKTAYGEIKHQTIFYQRPLKSQKKYIGKCQFETNKRTAPVSSLLYQEFRIWKQLADVRYTDRVNDIYLQPLPEPWKQKIVDFLQVNFKLNLREGGKKKDGTRNTDIMDVLGLTQKKNYSFNFDDDKTFDGNKTLAAIYTACGEDKFNQLKSEGKLDKLWHIVYMAKDDEWLKDTLTYSWEFDETTADNLIRMGLEDGFASYSSKVIQKILPHLKTGKDEYDSLVLTGYLKAPDEVKEIIILRKKIKQLANNELRNPVVEKAAAETIKLVNALLKEHDIDQENFTIRVESTRELKKPKKERENIRRGNLDANKRREEYAKFLNEKRQKRELNFSREIQKNDSIIHKFELWLELGADKDDPSFKDFETIVKKKDREKHTLWLECNRICPYTGKVITLTKLFSPLVEIEHIIPYSRCLNDSFMNKTLTFYEINKEKGCMTAFEYLKSKGDSAFRAFKERIKVFNDSKQKEWFLKEKVDQSFTNAQLANTSYIAKYVRNKMQEVCRDVQFTNGSATAELRKNDWRLGSILDKVRYEEETGINIDVYYGEFFNYKRDFEAYRKKESGASELNKLDWKNLTPELTAEYETSTKNPIHEWWQEIQTFETFIGAKGKKDRSDHRHHLLDAIVIALCSPGIIQQLSTLNRLREEQGCALFDDKGNLTRERIACILTDSQIKDILKSVLVYHKAEQKLITTKINRIHKKKQNKDDARVLEQKTIAPRGSLHKDSFYGKLKNPSHQGFKRDNVFVKRVNIIDKNGSSVTYNFPTIESLEKIIDKNVKEILKKRLIKYNGKGDKAFNEEVLNSDPIYLYSLNDYPDGLPMNPSSKKGNTLPVIKKVRVANKNSRNLIQLLARDEEKNIINENRYAEADGNYVMALYEKREFDKNGKVKIKRDFEIVSIFNAVEKRRKDQDLFPDEKLQNDGSFLPLMLSCPYLKAGDFVIMYENEPEEIKWNEIENLNRRLYKVTGLSSEESYGLISFIKHNISSKNANYGKAAFNIKVNQKSFTNRHTQLKAIKIKINNLGRITSVDNDLKKENCTPVSAFSEPHISYQQLPPDFKKLSVSTWEEQQNLNYEYSTNLTPEDRLAFLKELNDKAFGIKEGKTDANKNINFD